MYAVALKFHPRQANPARASGRGVWRVWACADNGDFPLPPVKVVGNADLMIVRSPRAYKPRSRVDPKRIVSELVAAQSKS